MSSRSNSRKQALQLLFSYEFDVAALLKDYLYVLCAYFVEANIHPDGYDESTMDKNQFLELIEHQILKDISFFFLIQNNAFISVQSLESTTVHSHQEALQSWLARAQEGKPGCRS